MKEKFSLKVGLVNPWSGEIRQDHWWTWKQILKWIEENYQKKDREPIIKKAKKAFENNNGKTLGEMIIGS
jgi:hypothetical protein